MRLIWVLTIALISPLFGASQNVSITGNALFYAGEKITIFQYKNSLTNEKQILDTLTISDSGKYAFELEITEPSNLGCKIEMREYPLHIHPNTVLQLDFYPIRNSNNQRINDLIEKTYLQIPNGVATDSVYHDLTWSFAELQYEIRIKSVIDKFYIPFFAQADSTYKSYIENDPLFATYYTYFKSNSLLLTSQSRTKLIQEFLINKPVQYYSKEYFKFINAALIPRINQLFIRNREEFDAAIKEYKIYDSLLKLMAKDSLLQSEELRSFALLTYVRSKTSSPMLTKELKNGIIGQMANFCQYPVQKEAAQYFRKKKKKLQVNTEAPIFELEDQYGQKLPLQKFRGKPVYLGFINSKSRTCNTDLMVIEQLRKEYKKAEFLMVLTDRDSVDMSKLPDEASNFNYVYLRKDYSILETYEIWSYPIYFFIDKHGYFIESPAKRPEEMYSTFEKMFTRKSRRKKYEIIKD